MTAYQGATPVNAVVTGPDARTATVGDLAGGLAHTVKVQAVNVYGDGPALTSPAVTPTGGATTYSAKVRANAPEAYYRFQEAPEVRSAADSSGGGALLTVDGHDTGGGGALGSADLGADIDGGAYFAASTVPGIALGADPRTVEAWVKPRDGREEWFAGWGTDGTDNSFSAGTAGAAVQVNAGGDNLRFPTSRTLADGVWHHVAVTATPTGVSAYLDGVLLGTRQFAGAPDTGGDRTLRVGSYFNGQGSWYGGLDEVAVYDHALTAADLAAHFAASGHARPGAVTGVTAVAQANAVAVSWDPPPAAADPLGEYVVRVYRGTTPVNGRSVPAGTTSTQITGLPAGVAVNVKVSPLNAYGLGAAGGSENVTPTGAASTYASVVQAAGPSAYYRLGEAAGVQTASDSAGAAARIQIGRALLGQPGAIAGDGDTAAYLDGSCCIATGAVKLPTGNSSRSVEAWVKPSDDYSRWILAWGQAATDRSFHVGVDGRDVLVDTWSDGLRFPTPRPLRDGAWHLVTVTYDGGTGNVTAYLDGTALGTKGFVEPDLTTAAGTDLVLGAGVQQGAPFYGGLDDVAVYTAALAAATVKAHFTASGHAPPGAVTSLTVTSRANGAAVSWHAPATGEAPQRYIVTALRGGVARNAIVVDGGATTAVLTGLAGGAPYTIRVVAANAFGDGTAAVSAAVTPTGAASTYATEVLADAPTGYYRLSEAADPGAAANSAGPAGLLTVTGGTFGTATGALRSDTDRAATSNYRSIGTTNLGALPKADAPRTLEAWVQPLTDDTQYVAGYGTSSPNRAFAIGTRGSSVIADYYGTEIAFAATRRIADGAWHHVAATYDGTRITLYLDGVSLGSRAPGDPLETQTDGTFVVGSYVNGAGPVNGGVDEVAVYPGALTAARIQAHFTASGHARPGVVPSVTASAGANRANVSWATAPGPDPATWYTVTASRAGRVVDAMTVNGTVRTAVLSGLPGSAAVTVQVVAGNQFGPGAAGAGVAVTPTGSATTYAGLVVAATPLAYYRLGESAGSPLLADSSGHEHPLMNGHGTLGATGALSTDPDRGATADAYCCLGSGPSPDLPKSNDARSVEFWSRPIDSGLRWQVGWGVSDTRRSFDVGTTDTQIYVNSYNNDLTFAAGKSLTDGLWHHVVVSYDGTNATVYVDGVSRGAQAFPAKLRTSTSSSQLVVGAAHDGSSPAYGGLDEVAVYGAAVTAAQVTAHYTSGH